MATSFEKMTLNQRIQAVNIDCMRHPQFALLAGVICMGRSEVVEGIPTAGTDGKHKKYGAKFITPLNRKQLRYLVCARSMVTASTTLLWTSWSMR